MTLRSFAIAAPLVLLAPLVLALPSPIPDDTGALSGLSMPAVITAVTDTGIEPRARCTTPLVAALEVPDDTLPLGLADATDRILMVCADR